LLYPEVTLEIVECQSNQEVITQSANNYMAERQRAFDLGAPIYSQTIYS
jgi:hypothetical protein